MKKELCREELRAVEQVKQAVGDPSLGLPEPVFEMLSSMTPMVNVDLLIQDEQGRILMTWREDAVCGCGWHIPGGIIRFHETAAERLQKTAQNELGVQVRFDGKPVSIKEILLPQAVRGHFISFLYRCFLPEDFQDLPEAEAGRPYRPGERCWHRTCPDPWVRGQRTAYRDLFDRGV